MRVSRLNEKMTRDQNEVLERRVSQRTEELEERNDRLRATLEELKLTQDQLVQSEKLASVGQLTAALRTSEQPHQLRLFQRAIPASGF